MRSNDAIIPAMHKAVQLLHRKKLCEFFGTFFHLAHLSITLGCAAGTIAARELLRLCESRTIHIMLAIAA